jgi:hypothetical protein
MGNAERQKMKTKFSFDFAVSKMVRNNVLANPILGTFALFYRQTFVHSLHTSQKVYQVHCKVPQQLVPW